VSRRRGDPRAGGTSPSVPPSPDVQGAHITTDVGPLSRARSLTYLTTRVIAALAPV